MNIHSSNTTQISNLLQFRALPVRVWMILKLIHGICVAEQSSSTTPGFSKHCLLFYILTLSVKLSYLSLGTVTWSIYFFLQLAARHIEGLWFTVVGNNPIRLNSIIYLSCNQICNRTVWQKAFYVALANSLVIWTLLWDIKYLPFPLVFLESSFGPLIMKAEKFMKL